MTNAPSDLLSLRHKIMTMTGITNPVEVGIVGDEGHDKGYHLGIGTIRARGNYPDNDYSTVHPRDRVGGDDGSAMDVSLAWPKGGRAAAIAWSNKLANAAKAGLLPEISEINWMKPDGNKRRWTADNGREVASSDTVDIHTHIGWWRDTIGNRQKSFDFMLGVTEQKRSTSMQFWSVTAVPAGVTDIVGNSIINLTRVCPTPKGPFAYLYGEIIDPFTDAPKQTITMTYPRFIQLCNAWAPEPLNLDQLAAGISDHYPVDAVTKDVIIAALKSDDGHAAFIELMEQNEVKAILAEQVEYAEDH